MSRGSVVNRHASVAEPLRFIHSLRTVRLCTASDRCTSVDVPSLGWTDRWPRGPAHLPVQHWSMWLDFTDAGESPKQWL